MSVESVERIGGLPAPIPPSPPGTNTPAETAATTTPRGRCLRCGGEFPGDAATCPRCAVPLIRLAPPAPQRSASPEPARARTGEEEVPPFHLGGLDGLDDDLAPEADGAAIGVEVRRRGGTIFVGYTARRRRSPVQLTVHDLLLPLGVLAIAFGRRALESVPARIVLGTLLAFLALAPAVRSPGAAAAPGMRQGFGGFQGLGGAGGRGSRPDGGVSDGSTNAAFTPPSAAGSLSPAATLVASQSPVADLLAGNPVSLGLAGSGQWLRAGDGARIRLDPIAGAEVAPDRAAIDSTQAAERERRVLAGEFRRVEPIATQLVMARHLAPPDPGAPVAAGRPTDIVLESRPAWVVTLLAYEPTTGPNRSFASLFPLLEVTVLDAHSGQALLRTPPLPLPVLNRAFPRPPLSPSSDPTRPLGYFGDAAP